MPTTSSFRTNNFCDNNGISFFGKGEVVVEFSKERADVGSGEAIESSRLRGEVLGDRESEGEDVFSDPLMAFSSFGCVFVKLVPSRVEATPKELADKDVG